MHQFRRLLLAGATSLIVATVAAPLHAETALPLITVASPEKLKAVRRPRPQPRRTAAKSPVAAAGAPRLGPRPDTAVAKAAPTAAPGIESAAATNGGEGGPVSPQLAAARAGEAKADKLRERIYTQGGASVTEIGRAQIEAQPQGDNAPFDRTILQLPGVTQDSSASGDFHIRNEHANVQYRINGIQLPDGVSGFSQVLTSSSVRSIALIDGALPAQYGLHTAGLLDITTRTGAENPGTTITGYGGTFRTIIPTIDTAGVAGGWDYFFTGRFVSNDIGIESATPTQDPIHDASRLGQYFGYAAHPLGDSSRFVFMSGASAAHYQIPNTIGAPPQFTAFNVSDFASTALNETQNEHTIFNILALQTTIGPLDSQTSYFQRYSTLHYIPDQVGDLVFNGVASDVTRTSLVNGIQNDNAYKVSNRQIVRFGSIFSVEKAQAINSDTVLPLDGDGNPVDTPFKVFDAERPTGLVGGLYVQDEYRLTREITINAGLRFDAIDQYVQANQLSPRASIVYTPTPRTVIHAGYARTFTPPELSLSAPTPLVPFGNTTAAPEVTQNSPVRPERAHVFDIGITQQVTPKLAVGLDGYYKIAKNLLDDGQFGQALVLTAYNYDHAFNDGVEFKATYRDGGFAAYGNVAAAQQQAKQVTSNQYLFGQDELDYIANNYVYTDHAQLITASGGASYLYAPTRTTLTTDFIYGSGLRAGFANTTTVPQYASWNLGLLQELRLNAALKPTLFRFAVVNVLDHTYAIRDGSGIGVFSPQYGQRRGFFASLAQRF